MDRLIIRAACAAVAVIGLAIVVAGIYPLAWVADVAGSLGLAGMFAAGGFTALVTGRRTKPATSQNDSGPRFPATR